jgi:hypothetical protein
MPAFLERADICGKREVGVNPPKSPLKRGPLKAPFLRGLGDLDLKAKSSPSVAFLRVLACKVPSSEGCPKGGVGRSTPLIKQNPHGFKCIRSTIGNQCKPIVSFFITHRRDRLGNFNDAIGFRNWLQYLK